MSVKRCQEEVSQPEFQSWLAYYSLEPFGEERADYRSAIIACTFANVMRTKTSHSSKVEDFMPKFGQKTEQNAKSMEKAFALFANLHNARIKKGK